MTERASSMLWRRRLASRTFAIALVVLTMVNYFNYNAHAESTADGDPIIIDLFNYPNPFEPANGPTHITYELAQDADVELLIYDLSGDRVIKRNFDAGALGGTAGNNTVDWDGRNDRHEEVTEGAFICAVRVLVSKKGSDVYERKSTKIGVMR